MKLGAHHFRRRYPTMHRGYRIKWSAQNKRGFIIFSLCVVMYMVGCFVRAWTFIIMPILIVLISAIIVFTIYIIIKLANGHCPRCAGYLHLKFGDLRLNDAGWFSPPAYLMDSGRLDRSQNFRPTSKIESRRDTRERSQTQPWRKWWAPSLKDSERTSTK